MTTIIPILGAEDSASWDRLGAHLRAIFAVDLLAVKEAIQKGADVDVQNEWTKPLSVHWTAVEDEIRQGHELKRICPELLHITVTLREFEPGGYSEGRLCGRLPPVVG